jgi:hypothetical protein
MRRPLDREKAISAIAKRVRIEPSTGCWLWTLCLDLGGYGTTSHYGLTWRAHRLSYEAHVGPIPDGMVIDHLCRIRHCVNPAHLEPVTSAENIRRGETGAKPKDICKRGHLFSEHGEITRKGHKRCKACVVVKRQEIRAASPPKFRGRKGESHSCARITEADVIAIRSAPASRDVCGQFAERLRLSRRYITDIRIGKSWKHVQPRNHKEAVHGE